METARKDVRNYTKRSKAEKQQRLQARLATLKAAHEVRAKLIEKLEAKLKKDASVAVE